MIAQLVVAIVSGIFLIVGAYISAGRKPRDLRLLREIAEIEADARKAGLEKLSQSPVDWRRKELEGIAAKREKIGERRPTLETSSFALRIGWQSLGLIGLFALASWSAWNMYEEMKRVEDWREALLVLGITYMVTAALVLILWVALGLYLKFNKGAKRKRKSENVQ